MQISIIPEKVIFYNQDNSFGIVACATDSQEVVLSKWNTITIKGNIPYLEIGKKYDAEVEEVKDKKWGTQYNVKYIYEQIPSTFKEEKEYLKIMLTERQVKEIYKIYPEGGIIELIENNKFNYDKIKGLGEKSFNKIKMKLLDNLKFQKALIELSKFGITYRMIMKLIKRYKYTDIVLKKIKENPYILADEVQGISFLKCDVYALNMGIEKESDLRIDACIKYILKKDADNNGNSWMYKEDVIDECYKLLNINRNIIVDYVAEIDRSDQRDRNDQVKRITELWIDEKRIALSKYYKYEYNIYCKIQELINSKSNITVDIDVNKMIDNIEKRENIELTDQQKEAIIMATKHNVLIVNGEGGTGKSTVLKSIIEILNTNNYATCALSGKAVQRIVELEIKSSTIHRLLDYKPDRGFGFNLYNKLPYDIIALDEMSMVNSGLLWRLIQSIENGSKFIMLGDVEQLEPIGAGFVLRDLLNNVPTITLTKIHRQAKKSGIITIASKVRKGEQIKGKGAFGELKDFFFYPYSDKEMVYKKIIQMCKGYKNKYKDDVINNIMDFQVLVPMKNRGLCTKRLNKDLQNIFNENRGVKFGSREFREGDKVIQQGNNYEKEVFNGTLGLIEYIWDKCIIINFDGRNVEYSRKEMDDIDLAYAITIHKDQGSQHKHVILGIDYSAYTLLSRQLIYTGITRAIESCVVACELNAWRYGVGRNRGERRTFLGEIFDEVG